MSDAERSKQRKSAPIPPPSRWKRYRTLALEALLLLGVYIAASAWQGKGLLSSHELAPNFTLQSLNGPPVSLASLRGKRVLLHFWATWCGVCAQEHPALSAVQRGLGSNEALYAIVADSDDPAAVRRYVSEHHIDYPVLLASDDVVRAYRVGAFPTNYFITADGRISGTTVGMTTRWGLEARLALAR